MAVGLTIGLDGLWACPRRAALGILTCGPVRSGAARMTRVVRSRESRYLSCGAKRRIPPSSQSNGMDEGGEPAGQPELTEERGLTNLSLRARLKPLNSTKDRRLQEKKPVEKKGKRTLEDRKKMKYLLPPLNERGCPNGRGERERALARPARAAVGGIPRREPRSRAFEPGGFFEIGIRSKQ